jgi:hypothetical protein
MVYFEFDCRNQKQSQNSKTKTHIVKLSKNWWAEEMRTSSDGVELVPQLHISRWDCKMDGVAWRTKVWLQPRSLVAHQACISRTYIIISGAFMHDNIATTLGKYLWHT